VVKLTGFGLTTREEESDMDCGSAPYMSYERRNNVAPTYSFREADVALGIVSFTAIPHQGIPRTTAWSSWVSGAIRLKFTLSVNVISAVLITIGGSVDQRLLIHPSSTRLDPV